MRTGEKIAAGCLVAAIAINVAVLAVIVVTTEQYNPLYWLGFLIPIAALGWWLRGILRNWRTRVRARAAGLKGRLRVLRASELMGGAATVNEQPYVRLELELRIPGREPERFTKRMVVPRLAIPAVMGGASFDVWVDPKDHRRFDVDW